MGMIASETSLSQSGGRRIPAAFMRYANQDSQASSAKHRPIDMHGLHRCSRLRGNIRFRNPRSSGMNDAHSMASSLVAHWRPKPILEVHEARTIEHEFFRLTFPGPYLVAVTFYRVEERPDLMRVRSTNWRTQDEPNGIFRIEDCREFYRRLRRAGFE